MARIGGTTPLDTGAPGSSTDVALRRGRPARPRVAWPPAGRRRRRLPVWPRVRPARRLARLALLLAVLVLALGAVTFFSLAGAPPTRSAGPGSESGATGLTVDFAPAACARLPSPEDRVCDYGPVFNLAGRASGVDPRLLAAVAHVESGYAADVIACERRSEDGALGLMQFMPATARERGVDPCDTSSAIYGAAGYLRQHYDELGTWELALAAYNAGAGDVRAVGGIPVNGETEAYVPAVVAKWQQYRQLFPATGTGACPVQPRGTTAPVVDRGNTPATQAMADAVVACFGREHAVYCEGARASGRGEHPRGRACDFMLTSGGMPDATQRAHGDAMAQWLVQNAQQLHVLYVIWYDRIWYAGRDAAGLPLERWRDYPRCRGGGDPSSCHYNHVHVSVSLMPGDPASARCGGTGGCYE